MDVRIPEILLPQLAVFILVLVRLSGLFLAAPFFSGPVVPQRLKVLFAVAAAGCLAPVFSGQGEQAMAALRHPLFAVLAVAVELGIGLAIGFLAGVVIGAIQTAGYYIAQDIGYTIANIIDPLSDLQTSVIGQLKAMVALELFLLLDLHHHLLRLLSTSFEWIPLATLVKKSADIGYGGAFKEIASQQGTFLLDTAARLALPITVTLILVTTAMAFLSRAVPELNVFISGFAVRILIGVWVLILLFPFLDRILQPSFERMVRDGWAFLRMLSGQ